MKSRILCGLVTLGLLTSPQGNVCSYAADSTESTWLGEYKGSGDLVFIRIVLRTWAGLFTRRVSAKGFELLPTSQPPFPSLLGAIPFCPR
jgi:hypothetical protein